MRARARARIDPGLEVVRVGRQRPPKVFGGGDEASGLEGSATELLLDARPPRQRRDRIHPRILERQVDPVPLGRGHPGQFGGGALEVAELAVGEAQGVA